MTAPFAPLTLRALRATPVAVPMKRPLGTSVQAIREACLLLLDLETDEGVTGRAYAFCYHAAIARALPTLVEGLTEVLAGARVAPAALRRRLGRHLRLPGVAGPLAMVAATVDSAAWDALAIAAGMPLTALLGAAPSSIQAYNSNGLGIMPAEAAADEAEALLAEGFNAVKLRLGGRDLRSDLAVVRAVRNRIPQDAVLMVDFNQALSFAEAMRTCPALDGEGIYWIEEPIRHDDHAHSAKLAQSVRTPIQTGENYLGLPPVAASLAACASDFLMFDHDRIGGVSGWNNAVGLATAYGREVSSHLFPEVSAHLLAATPGAHWLEFVDWASPILQEPLRPLDGAVNPIAGPGTGLRWDLQAVARFRLD